MGAAGRTHDGPEVDLKRFWCHYGHVDRFLAPRIKNMVFVQACFQIVFRPTFESKFTQLVPMKNRFPYGMYCKNKFFAEVGIS